MAFHNQKLQLSPALRETYILVASLTFGKKIYEFE